MAQQTLSSATTKRSLGWISVFLVALAKPKGEETV